MIIKSDQDSIKSYLEDASGLRGAHTGKVIFPESPDEVSETLQKCYQSETPLTISGGGTGVTGGRLPFDGDVLATDRFDKIIDFQNNNRSHLLAFLCFPRASYGYRNKKLGCLLSHGILNDQMNIPPVRHQFRLLEQLGIVYDKDVRLEMWPRADDVVYAKELLHGNWIDEKNHIVVGINISASERWATKNLPMKSVAELCDKMSADNIRVVITGMEKDASLARQLGQYLKSKPAILVGKTNLLQLAALISLCKGYVTSDSAPLHVAAAMNVPVVALFGPTSPERHVPPAAHLKVIKKEIACQACYLTECKNKKHACMVDITPNEIYAEIKKFLGKA